MNLSSGAQSLITGALFDFIGYLTTRPKTIKAGEKEPVYDLHEALTKWAKERKLDLQKADVQGWAKVAETMDLRTLAEETKQVGPRVAGALRSFVEYAAETSDVESALLKWASKTGLEIHDPQPQWSFLGWD